VVDRRVMWFSFVAIGCCLVWWCMACLLKAPCRGAQVVRRERAPSMVARVPVG
jgi:hypothetical protein